MPSPLHHNLLRPAILFLALASCSPAAPTPQAGGGIGGTGTIATVSSGPVTQFGSVYVSGTEYDNTHTLYCIDLDPCTQENRLKLGMVVLVNGIRTVEYPSNQTLTHVADTITYEETVEGEVQSVAADGLSLVVLGQIVSVNQKTEIDSTLQGTSPHTLNPTSLHGRLVEVSGFVTGDGTILATLIQPHTGLVHYEVEGVIKNHDRTAKTFKIGSLVVDYSSPTTDISYMPSSANRSWDGVIVFVRGNQWNQSGTGPNGARMTATSVKPKALGVSDIQESEVEDFVTRVDGLGDFYLNNVHVQTNSGTVFEGGTVTDIQIGSHLEVDGPLVGNILNATKVEFESETELQATIAAVAPADNTLTLFGLESLTIQFDNRTALSGQGSPRQIGDLRAGDHLQIHGRLHGGAVILATEVERTDPSSRIQIEGRLTTAADPLLVLFGSTIDTSPVPDSGFRGPVGIIGRTAFFSGLLAGQKISLRGTLAETTVVWATATRTL